MSRLNEREFAFSSAYKEKTGLDLLYESNRYDVVVDGIKRHYHPDFFCPATGELFEVVGSRQAFSANRTKIEAFRAQYPDLTLHVVRPDGEPYVYGRARVYKYLKERPFYRARLLAHDSIREAAKTERISSLSERLGINYATLWQLVDGHFPNPRTAIKILSGLGIPVPFAPAQASIKIPKPPKPPKPERQKRAKRVLFAMRIDPVAKSELQELAASQGASLALTIDRVIQAGLNDYRKGAA